MCYRPPTAKQEADHALIEQLRRIGRRHPQFGYTVHTRCCAACVAVGHGARGVVTHRIRRRRRQQPRCSTVAQAQTGVGLRSVLDRGCHLSGIALSRRICCCCVTHIERFRMYPE